MVLEVGMESPESYVSSPEVTDSYNRSPTPQNGTNPDDKEKPTSIRFLVSNAEAGSVIGKGGSTITEFQLQSRTRIQLSRNHEYFPGTTDRIIMVTGGVNEILTAVELILLKLESESHSEVADAADSMSKMRLIVPNSSCGGIIGKGGSTIKSFTEDSQAGIKISPQDHGFTGVSDRVVTVTGSLEEKLRALHLIVDKLAADSHYSQYANSPLSYTGANFSGVHNLPAHSIVPSVYNTVNYGSKGASGKLSYSKTRASNQTATFGSRPTAKMQPNSEGCGTEMGILTSVMALEPFNGSREIQNSPASKPVTLGIADEHIGLVVGRGGRNIAKVTQVSGARIKISDRGDFISGTSNRKVTISGTKDAIRVAQTLIEQRIASFLSEDSLANVGSGKSAECN